jgi:hypothetical protein
LKKTFFTFRNIIILFGIFLIFLTLLLYFLAPNLFKIYVTRVLIAILIVATIVYLKVKNFISMKRGKVYFKDKEIREKREAILRRDNPFISKAITNRDSGFLWQKSLEYEQEVYLCDKAEELWQEIIRLDSSGYYGKMAQDKLQSIGVTGKD